VSALTVYMAATTLDGYIADEQGGLDWLFAAASDPTDPDAEHPEYDEFIADVGALCMGADTYRFIVGEDAPWAYGDRPTWVFTHGEPAVPDGADVRFVSGRPADLHAEMVRSAGGRSLWLVGGGDLASQFVEAGLLDELIVALVPVVLGAGIPLFARGVPGQLQLLRSRTLPDQLVEVTYALPRDG
jgi:dihydrofolate reductase